MNTHIHHMVKRIVHEDQEFGVDGNEEMIALAINKLIRDLAKGVIEKYPEFGVDEIEEMIALVMKCLLSGVDAEKVINATFARMGANDPYNLWGG